MVLQIFAPKKYSKMRYYELLELAHVTSDLGDSTALAEVTNALSADVSAEVQATEDVQRSFDEALRALDSFIKANFKIEEVLSAGGLLA